MELKPGLRLRSAADDTELIVVKAPPVEVDLRCGGHPVIGHGIDRPVGPAVHPALAGGTQIGKRYTDVAATLELLCTKAGQGTLTVGGEPLLVKDAKPLPSSD